MNTVREPLELSAAIARRIATQMCRRSPDSGEDCAWLHGFWQCLRLMRVAATPDRHADFYREALARVEGAAATPRVLVCGAADYSMLAHALAAFRCRNVEPAISVIDVCDTPLYLNRWYAEREACNIETHRRHLLEYSEPRRFDVVCTHSFFGQFPRGRRPAMIAAWRGLLRPGGLVVTTLPLRPGSAEEPNRFTSGQAESFRAGVLAHAKTLAEFLDSEPEDIIRQGERYLEARYGYPVDSSEEVRELFASEGFAVEQLSCAVAPTEKGLDAGGPGLRCRGVEYASVVARRL